MPEDIYIPHNNLFEGINVGGKELTPKRRLRLFEGIASARKTYVDTGKINKETFNKLLKKDPSPNKKYIDWISKMFYQEHIADMDIDMKFDSVKEFHILLSKNKIPTDKRDLYAFKTTEDLVDLVVQFDEQDKMETDEKVVAAKAGAKHVFSNEKADIYEIISPQASVYYGTQALHGGLTDWCTTNTVERAESKLVGDYRHTQGKKLYYIIPKGESAKKYDKMWVLVDRHGKTEIGGTSKFLGNRSQPENVWRPIFQDMGIPIGANK